MKKGIVMEKHRKYTIIMTENGLFLKVKPVRDAVIGAEVSCELINDNKRYLFIFHPKKKVKNTLRVVAMACLLLLFVLPFYFISGSNKTYAYVNIDINPNVELEIDDQLHVQAIKPLNDDASLIIDKLPKYKNQPLEKVVTSIMDSSEKSGLVKNGKNVIVGVSYVDNNDISILDTLDRFFTGHKVDWNIATFLVPKAVRKKAEEQNKSMNELMAKDLDEEGSRHPEAAEKLNNTEKAMINSFYNNNKEQEQHEQKTEANELETKNEGSQKSQHPNDSKNKHSHNGQKIEANQHRNNNTIKNKGNASSHRAEPKHKQHENHGNTGNHRNNGNHENNRDHWNNGNRGNHGNNGKHNENYGQGNKRKHNNNHKYKGGHSKQKHNEQNHGKGKGHQK
ncbi:anti-sigma factor domain-containing protein [Virgibacillus sp. FSP13]